MSRSIKVNCTQESIKRAIRELEKYKKGIAKKTERFCSRLAEIGIKTARENTGTINDLGNVKGYITYYKELNPQKDGCKAILYGKDAVKYISTWRGADGKMKSAVVSPLLMAEFGSGSKANAGQAHVDMVHPNVSVGQGTFPDQTHAFDPNGWYWMDSNNQWHHSYGIKPTMPMFKAWLQMKNSINSVAREVFKQ